MKAVGLFFLLVVLTGCHVSSKTALEGSGGRNSYNDVLQSTNSEQMLVNIVRLRYYDIPFFLDVGNVTTQFTYKTAIIPSFPIPGFSEDNPAKIGGELSWQNQPTIQYSPLQGEAYASQLLQPISLRSIQQLCYSGWGVDRVLRLIVQGFNGLLNAPEASGPIPEKVPYYEKFFEATELLRYFQKRGELQIGVDIIKSKQSTESDNGDSKKEGHTLQFAFPIEGKHAKKLAKILKGERIHKGRYVLNMELGFDSNGKIGVLPRSILSSMYYLSQGVVVPPGDIKSGCAAKQEGTKKQLQDWEEKMDQLLEVKFTSSCPSCAFVKVKYRGKWFYIDDKDLESKKTFVLLMQLYNLQGGAYVQPPPLLTIPLG